MHDGYKLFAFFGADLKNGGLLRLRRATRDGYLLLALDGAAASLAVKADVSFTLVDDWLGADSIIETKVQAHAWEREWFNCGRDGFEYEGVCWPEFDREAMYWFWRDTTLAIALASAIQDRNIRDLLLLREETARPQLFFNPSDTVSLMLQTLLADTVATEIVSRRRIGFLRRPSWSGLLWRFRRWREDVRSRGREGQAARLDRPASAQLENAIVFAVKQCETFRFTPIIRQLVDDFPGRVAGVMLSEEYSSAIEASEAWGVPVFRQPQLNTDRDESSERFLRALTRVREWSHAEPWGAVLDSVPHHFEYYCTVRWPLLVSQLKAWRDVCGSNRPRMVIISSLQDGMSRIPAVAARGARVPTMSIPHGGGVNREQDVWVDLVGCGYRIPLEVFRPRNISDDRFVYCRDLVVDNEYPARPCRVEDAGDRVTVLALTNPVSNDGCLSPDLTPGAQVAALRTLIDPPPSVASRIAVRFKPHPGFPDTGIFSKAGVAREQLLPPKTDLSFALDRCGLVVAINYAGTALWHACRAGKPIILFWVDRMIGRTEPYTFVDYYLPSGTLARNSNELWGVVEAYLNFPDEAERMSEKARVFFAKNTVAQDCPTLGKAIEQILGCGGNEERRTPSCERPKVISPK